MNIFCDTSVLVAAVLRSHPHHAAAFAVMSCLQDPSNRGYTSAHALAETFSVLCRMPTNPKLAGSDVIKILEESIIPYFTFVSLPPENYPTVLREFAPRGFSGGAIYDFLHLKTAATTTLDSIYTFNATEWKRLSPEMASRITAPA